MCCFRFTARQMFYFHSAQRYGCVTILLLLEGRQRWSKRSEEAEVAILTGQVRRMLSIEGVRSQARCLIAWLHGLGAGASAAPRRRQWVSHEEQRLGRERMAHLISLGQGHYALWQGQFPLWFLTISHFFLVAAILLAQIGSVPLTDSA